MSIFEEQYRKRLEKLSTTNISDALDALGLKGGVWGIRPMMPQWSRVLGEAVTMRLISAGKIKSKNHLGVAAIEAARPGNIIVIDNSGRLDTSCWGGILANGAKQKGVQATVIDGACRDLDDCVEIDYPVFARGTVVQTARGRVIEESTGQTIQFAGVQVNHGDIVMGDRSGVVFIAAEHLPEVTAKAEEMYEKEEAMVREIRKGRGMLEVDNEFNYEKMLK